MTQTEKSKLRPRRLGHMVLMVRDIQKSAKFYTEVLGLEVSDWIGENMVFLRAGTDHHDLALAQLPETGDSPESGRFRQDLPVFGESPVLGNAVRGRAAGQPGAEARVRHEGDGCAGRGSAPPAPRARARRLGG